MIKRKDAELQADRCFEYHAGLYAGIVGATALFNRKALPIVAGVLGAGVALHAASLYAIPEWRESIVRLTASLMEDRQKLMSNVREEFQQARKAIASRS